MTLQLSKLSHDMEALGVALGTESARLEEAIPAAQETLRTIGLVDDLENRIKQAIGLHWTGAIPIHEPAADYFSPPPHPSNANIIAADGSQIYPDRHGLALYYLINIGSIVFPHGLDQAPTCNSQPHMYFETNDLYDRNHIIASAVVDAQRDIAELGELASRARAAVESVPTLALLDNGLLLYGAQNSSNHHGYEAALSSYLRELDTLRASGAALAGVVDRPRASQVLGLVHLARLHPEEISSESLANLGSFERINDAMLFRDLAPGERSALFVSGAHENLDRYQHGRHKICFFYVNTGHVDQPYLLRVEVPEWVVQDVEKLHLVHAGVVEQCHVTGGFPYVLMRAHELAVIRTRDRHDVDRMVAQSMLRSGLSPSISRKAQGKLWASSRKDT